MAMQKQLIQLENNLNDKNIFALEHLYSGLSFNSLEMRSQKYQVSFEPDLVSLYSWRNGCHTFSSPELNFVDNRAEFWPGHIFLDLDEAIRQGQNTQSYWYEKTGIIDSVLLRHRICLFSSLDWSSKDRIDRLFLPFSTEGALTFDPPLFYECGATKSDSEFMFDSLTNLIRHINFIYEECDIEAYSISIDSASVLYNQGVIKGYDRKLASEHRYESNPYCSELNKALFGCTWPSQKNSY